MVRINAMKRPFVSIITATLNSSEVLRDCLLSIASQTDHDYEVIVSDGGSTDDTDAILEEFAAIISHIRKSPDTGVYDAWNKVLPFANGKWVLFLGSDDMLADNHALARAKETIAELSINPGFVMFPLVFRRDGVDTVIRRSQSSVERSLKAGQMGIAHTSTLHHRRLFDEYGFFDAAFRIAGDLDFALRTWHTGVIVANEPVLAIMRSGGLSSSPKWESLFVGEGHVARLKNGMYVQYAFNIAWYGVRRFLIAIGCRWFFRQIKKWLLGSRMRLGGKIKW